MSRCAVFVIAVGQRPHPRTALRCGRHLEDAADDSAAFDHVVIIIAPLAERAASGSALEDQRGHHGGGGGGGGLGGLGGGGFGLAESMGPNPAPARSVAAACPRRS